MWQVLSSVDLQRSIVMRVCGRTVTSSTMSLMRVCGRTVKPNNNHQISYNSTHLIDILYLPQRVP
jgi:hypothetical protein